MLYLYKDFPLFNKYVYTTGANESGQLGLGDTEPRLSPNRVRADFPSKIVNVAVSTSHSVVLTAKGQVSCSV